MPSFDAQALALGRVTVQSALGEPLRVDIDLPEITPEEVSSLKATIAPPATFRSAGMDYNAALANVQVAVQRRSDGSYFLRLSGDRPINEPFVDVVLETSWSSGRIRRDFTMLFDPPAMRQGQQPLTAQTSPVQPSGSAESSAKPVAPRPQQPRPESPAAATTRAPAPPATTSTAKGDGKPVTVQAGDTAGKIAAANKPATVSLDQMLVAMLRSNPDAFGGGNINRLRAGTVLNLPSQEQAEAVPPAEAHETLIAQSRDFNEFRRKVAESVPEAPSVGSGRESRGTVQGKVDEKKPSTATPDRLTLSKGAVQGKAGEDRIARERASKESAARMAELDRNLAELNGVTAAANAPKAGPSASATAGTAGKASSPATGPSLTVGTPSATTAKPAPTPAASASAPTAAAPVTAAAPAKTTPTPEAPPATTSAAPAPVTATAPSAPAGEASAPAESAAPSSSTTSDPSVSPTTSTTNDSTAGATPKAAVAARKPAAVPAPAPERGLIDQMLDEPLVPGVIGAAVLALLGLVGWRARQRRRGASVDSSFLESRLQPDSFFGASGGQRVDTNEGTATGSSMVYSPSQLDAAGDVDPVAEADVYLAYGRDLQAEEILKEALRINPQRVAIHVKLLEIYAKRRDAKAFEQVASEAYSLTHGEGGEWARICELGQELDPANPMYKPGGHPGAAPAAPTGSVLPVEDAGYLNTTKQAAAVPAAAPAAIDLDLDLDFSLGDEPSPAASAPVTKAAPAPAAKARAPEMDFSAQQTQPVQLDPPSLDLADNSLDFSAEPPAAPAPAPARAAAAPAADAGMIEFDLGALSLDLDSSAKPAAPATPVAARATAPAAPVVPDEPAFIMADDVDSADPLATKLALAEEFNAIGDADGARSLAQEVIAEASGDLKSKAQKFLAEIG
ncbi:FimV/HubP family polar landmark protein [Ramlibacter sp. MMS24-I3-19]|uniref:FimV/HubP family polar landmark protein n=1 Tax=Ramlibacter sp. MMS24-I3-19 TaxID=3416606 RepID=UPI003D031448